MNYKEHLGPEKRLEMDGMTNWGRLFAWVLHASVFTGHLFAQAGQCFFWDGEQHAELSGVGWELVLHRRWWGSATFKVVREGRSQGKKPL